MAAVDDLVLGVRRPIWKSPESHSRAVAEGDRIGAEIGLGGGIKLMGMPATVSQRNAIGLLCWVWGMVVSNSKFCVQVRSGLPT
jgi:hypothetical protein